jgi:hypothetical protein
MLLWTVEETAWWIGQRVSFGFSINALVVSLGGHVD